jgi:hypothetical protein
MVYLRISKYTIFILKEYNYEIKFRKIFRTRNKNY